MSENFIEFDFPCKECLVAACCQKHPRIEVEDIHRTICFAIPSIDIINFPTKSYHKMLVECWANMGFRIFEVMNKQYEKGEEMNNHIPVKYLRLMRRMTDLLQWMINSKSWEDGQVHNFDKFEIQVKLKGHML